MARPLREELFLQLPKTSFLNEVMKPSSFGRSESTHQFHMHFLKKPMVIKPEGGGGKALMARPFREEFFLQLP